MQISRRSLLAGAAAVLPAVALAACSSSQEQQLLQAVNEACQLLPIGTTLVATLASSVPLLAPAAPIVQLIGPEIQGACTAFITAIENAIGVINNGGGTATVNVTTNNPAPKAMAALHGIARQIIVRHPRAVLRASGSRSITFVVPPHFL